MNILIVDDNETNLKVLRVMLESEGYKTAAALDGEQAMNKLAQGKFDAVISDILMPNMDGYHFCQAVRANAGLKDMPFLFYTSTCLSPSDEKLAMEVGADRYIRKPSPAAVLREALDQLIGTKNRKSADNRHPLGEEHVLKEYNEILVRKLEEKNLELAEQNKKLLEEQEKFQELVQNIDEVFFITSDQNRKMVFVSPAYETIWGRSCQSLYADSFSWMEGVHPDDRAGIERQLRESSAESNLVLEYRIIRPDGGLRWIRARTFPVRDGSGAFHRSVGIAQDITERKLVEDALHGSEEQLRQAQKMEAIGQLAGGIAHDFNNLLSVILGYSDFILKNCKDLGGLEPISSDVEEIKAAAMRAATLTRQLLAFSRRQVLQPVVMNLNESVVGLEKMLRRLIGENITLTSELDPSIGWVKADAGQIEQVIMNLVVNARDAMPNGGKVSIKTQNVVLDKNSFGQQSFQCQPGHYVMVSVSDTGFGMDAKTKLRIFEPFFTTKEKGKGTGLGLPTVFGIVKQSGGYILVDSEPDKGAVFRVYLPLVERESEPSPTEETFQALERGGETVLVVEDDAKIRAMIIKFLQLKSYNVLEASRGEEALALCEGREQPIHLMITDILMPGITGIELAAQFRASHPETKTLYMSGYADQAAFRQEVPEIKKNFLTKPFTSDALTDKIRRIIEA